LGWFKEGLLPCRYPDLVFYLTDGKIIYASITELHPHEENDRTNEELAAELDKVDDYKYYSDVGQNFYINKKGDSLPVACIHLGEYKRDYTGMVYRQLKDVEPIPEANERFLKLFPQYDNNLKNTQEELKNEVMRRWGIRY